MAKHNFKDIRNIAFVGHGAVGKTTLADYMLFTAGVSKRAGSVVDGSSLLDTDDDEKSHKHTLSSKLCHFEHAGKRVNLIDTPGYPDFICGPIGAIRAVETAVICVSALAGIEVNTRRTGTRAKNAGIGRMVVLTKCDLENIDLQDTLSHLKETFGQGCVMLNVPTGLGADFTGVVSTLPVPADAPADLPVDPKTCNQAVMDALVEGDEELMVKYLEGEALTADEISAGMAKAIAAGTLIPIYCVSAQTGVGVPELMDAIANVALPPDAISRPAKNGTGDVVKFKGSPDGPFVGQVFKTRIDPFVSKMSFVRVYSGTLHKDTSVDCSSTSKPIKIHQLFEIQGSKQEGIDEISAGDIAAVVKMDELEVGDTISKDADGLVLEPIKFPTPMIGLAVEPKSRADQTKISGALHKISEEDQTFRVIRNPQTKEMVMQGMSELHLQSIEEKLKHRDHVEIITHQPKIPYRETVSGDSEGHYRHKKQSGGSGQFAEVHLRISHCPHDIDPEEYFTKDRFESMRSYHYDPDLNSAFVDRISGGSIPNNFIPAVEKGIKERMEKGVLAGYQVQDVVCELFFGKDHPVDSNETAFKMAASHCFKNIFNEAKPSLLEPIVAIEVNTPGDKLGEVMGDLNGRRGRVEGQDGAPGGYQIIHGKVPLAEVMTYARALSSLTGGQGSFTLELSHYEMVPPNEQAKIVAEAVHAHEEEDHS